MPSVASTPTNQASKPLHELALGHASLKSLFRYKLQFLDYSLSDLRELAVFADRTVFTHGLFSGL